MRNCIVILNNANLIGILNHGIKNADGSFGKVRIDYKALLDYVVDGRKLLSAYSVSQYDSNVHNNRPIEQQQRNNKFFTMLSNFGWTPLQVSFDIMSQDTSNTLNVLWDTVMSPYYAEDQKFTLDIENTDVVFITGSGSWFNIIQSFKDSGFNTQIAFTPKATNKMMAYQHEFKDISRFLVEQHQKSLENASVTTGKR